MQTRMIRAMGTTTVVFRGRAARITRAAVRAA
jgi:hypothetical protein